jgi:hypothetical protein
LEKSTTEALVRGTEGRVWHKRALRYSRPCSSSFAWPRDGSADAII